MCWNKDSREERSKPLHKEAADIRKELKRLVISQDWLRQLGELEST